MTVAPEPLRDVIARYGLTASKALGQNFILDRHLLARIAAIPGPLDGALDGLQSLGIDPQRRAETLSVDEFVSLARLLA